MKRGRYLQAGRGCTLDLLVERAGGGGPKPARHDVPEAAALCAFVFGLLLGCSRDICYTQLRTAIYRLSGWVNGGIYGRCKSAGMRLGSSLLVELGPWR